MNTRTVQPAPCVARTHLRALRPGRKRGAQQGIVLLVVLVLILMATSTAVWALQSTAFEQRASTSVLEMSLSRAHSDCAAMAGIAVEELDMPRDQPISQRWTAAADRSTSYANKYNWPFAMPAASSAAPPSAIYACGSQMGRASREQHMLHESYQYLPPGATGPNSPARSLVVITGFGDIKPLGAVDSGGARMIYEVDTQARAYFDH